MTFDEIKELIEEVGKEKVKKQDTFVVSTFTDEIAVTIFRNDFGYSISLDGQTKWLLSLDSRSELQKREWIEDVFDALYVKIFNAINYDERVKRLAESGRVVVINS